jgi:NAD(P)-dependent dehydrogenase (short-subunit alcohol dehydrogenase family)
MLKALVTGGAGLIGSHIVDLLLRRGYGVRILDNLEPATHFEGRPGWIPAEAEFILGDVRNTDDVRRALQGVDVVFHQAAYGGFALELTKMTEVNAAGTAWRHRKRCTERANTSAPNAAPVTRSRDRSNRWNSAIGKCAVPAAGRRSSRFRLTRPRR